MPISCHFRDCKALLDTSLTHVSSAVASTRPLPLPIKPMASIIVTHHNRHQQQYQVHFSSSVSRTQSFCHSIVTNSATTSVLYIQCSDLVAISKSYNSLQVLAHKFLTAYRTWRFFKAKCRILGHWFMHLPHCNGRTTSVQRTKLSVKG